MNQSQSVVAVGTLSVMAGFVILCSGSSRVLADHNGLHTTPCNEPDTVGGGTLGNSPGAGLGWDVGSGQCNGSFAKITDPTFPSDGAGIELGLRIEERRVGQVTRNGANDYEVQLGHDDNAPAAFNRAWWNFQHSIAYDGDIDTLDSLIFKIRADVGPNLPSAGVFDMLALRSVIDDRNSGGTATYSDLYQTSQNPEFGWFSPTADTDANPNGNFDYDQEGAWRMTLTAERDGHTASVTICVHTPNAACLSDDYACYDVHESSRLSRDLRISASDQFMSQDDVRVKEAKEICLPVDKDHGGILNPDLHLVCYKVQSGDKTKAIVEVSNQFTTGGPQELRVKSRARRICVPSSKEIVAIDEGGRRDDIDDEEEDD